MKEINIVWFKRDLRVIDNEALYESSINCDVLPIYIIERDIWLQKSHSKRQWDFCKECLNELKEDLEKTGQSLVLKIGNVIDVFEELKNTFKIKGIYSHEETGDNLSYKRDQIVRKWSKENNIEWNEYKQFAVFRGNINRNNWSKLREKHLEKEIIKQTYNFKSLDIESDKLPTYEFFRFEKDHCEGRLKGGRKEAIKKLNDFIENKINNYSRDISSPERSFYSCSRLSPYISWGCISMREIFKKVANSKSKNIKMFTNRLVWHCHFIQKLESEPNIEFREFHPYFSNIRTKNDHFLKIWSEGKTGYPFLDACMRSLNHNGWINFRMRAMLMSFASYNLWIPWQESGLKLAQKFIDYEPGIHWSQCQMQSGTTSININRIYNPIKQGKDHDPNGNFIKIWLPELKDIPESYIHEPWLIDNPNIYSSIQSTQYIKPIVDIKETSRKARKLLHEISLKEGYSDISKQIYEKHGSRKSSHKKKIRKKINTKKFQKQLEINLDL